MTLADAVRAFLDHVRFRPTDYGGSYDVMNMSAPLTALHAALVTAMVPDIHAIGREHDLREAREVAERNAADCSHLRQSAISLAAERDAERQRADAAERAVEKYKKETATAWTRIAELEAALRGTIGAMEMQEGRERGSLHLSVSAAWDVWDRARVDAKATLGAPASPAKRPPAISEEAHRARLPPHPAVLLNPKDPASPAMATKDEQCDGCGHEPHSFDCNKVLPGDLGNVCGCEHVTARVYLDTRKPCPACGGTDPDPCAHSECRHAEKP